MGWDGVNYLLGRAHTRLRSSMFRTHDSIYTSETMPMREFTLSFDASCIYKSQLKLCSRLDLFVRFLAEICMPLFPFA